MIPCRGRIPRPSTYLRNVRLDNQQCWSFTSAMDNAIEEQTLPRFQDRRYYPVKPGDVLADRYRTVSKLGFGAYSTVWLARDQK